jgi:hypothetical protein
MKKSGLILLLGLLLGAAGFSAVYFIGTASSRRILKQPQPELAWLQQEFRLSKPEFDRVTAMHEAYLPQCAERCRRIEELSQKLEHLLAATNSMTQDIQGLLLERARTRAECETEMLKHFLEVSRTMPPEQGRRYLAWVEQETILHAQSMEQKHH